MGESISDGSEIETPAVAAHHIEYGKGPGRYVGAVGLRDSLKRPHDVEHGCRTEQWPARNVFPGALASWRSGDLSGFLGHFELF